MGDSYMYLHRRWISSRLSSNDYAHGGCSCSIPHLFRSVKRLFNQCLLPNITCALRSHSVVFLHQAPQHITSNLWCARVPSILLHATDCPSHAISHDTDCTVSKYARPYSRRFVRDKTSPPQKYTALDPSQESGSRKCTERIPTENNTSPVQA